MRGRQEDPDLWGDLYERYRRPSHPARRRHSVRIPAETSGRLIDATIGILDSIRTFVDVAEEALEDRRGRLGGPYLPPEPWVRPSRERSGRSVPVQDDGPVVREIPLEDR